MFLAKSVSSKCEFDIHLEEGGTPDLHIEYEYLHTITVKNAAQAVSWGPKYETFNNKMQASLEMWKYSNNMFL